MSTHPYSVVEAISWQRDDGRTASIYGACPWTSEPERARWKTVPQGWTVADARNGTVGCGRVPWKTREEAQDVVDTWNTEHAERMAYFARKAEERARA